MEETISKKHNYSQGTTSSITVQIKSSNIQKVIEKFREEEKLNISPGDIITHAAGQALLDFPEFNSSFAKKGEPYPDVNIGYAINLGHGPKTVVIKSVANKSIIEVASEVKKLAVKYIRKELSEEDMNGGTFSISNLSSFGVHTMNTPTFEDQSALLSINSEYDSIEFIKERPIPIKLFNLSLSFDFRVANCQQAAQFLKKIKHLLEKCD